MVKVRIKMNKDDNNGKVVTTEDKTLKKIMNATNWSQNK